jgi:hypothetical protein
MYDCVWTLDNGGFSMRSSAGADHSRIWDAFSREVGTGSR